MLSVYDADIGGLWEDRWGWMGGLGSGGPSLYLGARQMGAQVTVWHRRASDPM